VVRRRDAVRLRQRLAVSVHDPHLELAGSQGDDDSPFPRPLEVRARDDVHRPVGFLEDGHRDRATHDVVSLRHTVFWDAEELLSTSHASSTDGLSGPSTWTELSF